MRTDPTIELRVHGMGEQMISAIGVEAMYIADRMQEAVRKAINNFDFDKYIEAQANQALQDYVESPEGQEQVRQIFQARIQERLQQFSKGIGKFNPRDRVIDNLSKISPDAEL